MTTPLIGNAAKTAPIKPCANPVSLFQPYADAGYRCKQRATTNPRSRNACKRRANCLKPKEISPSGHFDLQRALNYLKVKRSAALPPGGART
jgi:hypothetical protein